MIPTLRPYQAEAVRLALREWEESQSTLIVAPTGTGKTMTFCEIIRQFQPKRAMILAHRSELISQAVKKLWRFGVSASVEKADEWADEHYYNRSPVVVSTPQTQIAGRNGNTRMLRFDPNDFGLLVVDEAHHYCAPSFKKVIDYYRQNKNLKVLGVTATPDRADELALGQIFESVASDYEILDAIHDGWLVPVDQQMVRIEGLDFSAVRTQMGDLNGADLAAVMEAEKNLHGIASASIDVIGSKRTLVFTCSVKQAERLAEIFNRHRAHMADWLCASTPASERSQILRDFAEGRTQVLVNVGILTEGYDEPTVECVVQARPTKSRCLYAQIIGRSLRPLDGLVDGVDTADDRKDAISRSPKPSALVLDFVGNSGKHKLMTTADILGGKLSDEAIEKAIERAKTKGTPVRMDQELDKAEKDVHAQVEVRKAKEAARRAHVTAQANFKVRSVNPFDILELSPSRARGWDTGKQISEKQRAFLLKNSINPDKLSYGQQKQMLVALFARMGKNLCSVKQAQCLRKFGYDTRELTFHQASNLITELKNNGWRKPNAA